MPSSEARTLHTQGQMCTKLVASLERQLAEALKEVEQLRTQGPQACDGGSETAATTGNAYLPAVVVIVVLAMMGWRCFVWIETARQRLDSLIDLRGGKDQLTLRQYVSYRIDCWYIAQPL